MLVFGRKKTQRVRIGDEIEVVVCEIRGDKVKLGFVAPAGVAVHREEVFQRIQAAAATAAESEGRDA